MNSTKIKVEVIFGDVTTKNSITTEQITKLNTFLTKVV